MSTIPNPESGGYQQPFQSIPGAAAVPSSDARTWAMLAHLGTILLGFIAPLVVMLTKGNEDAFVKDQATEALNFQITLIIGYVASFILMFVLIGILTFFLLIVCAYVFAIIGGIKANKGEAYRYPFALRLIK